MSRAAPDAGPCPASLDTRRREVRGLPPPVGRSPRAGAGTTAPRARRESPAQLRVAARSRPATSRTSIAWSPHRGEEDVRQGDAGGARAALVVDRTVTSWIAGGSIGACRTVPCEQDVLAEPRPPGRRSQPGLTE